MCQTEPKTSCANPKVGERYQQGAKEKWENGHSVNQSYGQQ